MSAEPLTLTVKIKPENRYRKYLEITSLFLDKRLSPLQIDILDELYQFSKGELTTESRRHVRESLNKSQEQINNYILKMRKRKLIIDDNVNPKLLVPIPEMSLKDVSPRFKINVEMILQI